MFKINDYIIFRKDVCKIKDIKENNGNSIYILSPIEDSSLTIKIPVDNKSIRKVMSKKEVESLIDSINSINALENINDKMIEQEYKKLLLNNTQEDLIKIIKTAYLRNDKRSKDNKKLSERDSNYLKKAEKLLYNEFSVSLNMNYEDTKKYVIDKVAEQVK